MNREDAKGAKKKWRWRGFLVSFNVALIKERIKRVIHSAPSGPAPELD